jgi:hypothetical protein
MNESLFIENIARESPPVKPYFEILAGLLEKAESKPV